MVEILVERQLKLAPFQVTPHLVSCNTIQISGQRASIRVKPRRLTDQSQKYLLRHIVSQTFVAAHLQCKSINWSLVPLIKHREGTLVAGSCQPQQFFVAKRLRIAHLLGSLGQIPADNYNSVGERKSSRKFFPSDEKCGLQCTVCRTDM